MGELSSEFFYSFAASLPELSWMFPCLVNIPVGEIHFVIVEEMFQVHWACSN